MGCQNCDDRSQFTGCSHHDDCLDLPHNIEENQTYYFAKHSLILMAVMKLFFKRVFWKFKCIIRYLLFNNFHFISKNIV